jgi:putative (di)nucleoside polyphosphate hydrolase
MSEIIRPDVTAYRPCVGVMLLNRDRLVWVGRRFEKQNDDGVGKFWQMPQGGIEKHEDPARAAIRELAEETSVTSAEIITQSQGWYNYDLPADLIGINWKGKYRGQTQKWFAMQFLGSDSEINLKPLGHSQEFDEWRWVKMDELLDLIIPFKRAVYVEVIGAFRHLTT